MHSTASSSKTLSARLREDQSGAIMILALAFLVVVLALAVGLIGLAQTGSASLRAYRLERSRRYAADSALQAAVQYVKLNPGLGVSTSPPACGTTFTVQEDTAGGLALQVFTAGSTLTVTCEATPGVTNSGDRELDLAGRATGGQLARDVTFTVTCLYNTIPAKGTLTCGSGGNTLLLARARVRYDIDYDPKLLPATPTIACGPISDDAPSVPLSTLWTTSYNLCTASAVRAVVPKIVYWSIKGG